MADMRATTAAQADLLPVQHHTYLLMACDARPALLGPLSQPCLLQVTATMANYWTGGRGGGEKNFEHKGVESS